MAKQSLAAQQGTLTVPMKLPSIFSAPQGPVKGRTMSPYVVFSHPNRTDEWNRIQAKYGKIDEGDMFLLDSDEIVELPTMKASLIACQQYWAKKNAVGEVQDAKATEQPEPYKEEILAALLVYLDDRIVPATVSFRTTKCPGGKSLADALLEAATPKWADKSAAHAETLILPQPFMRFYGLIELGPQRIGRGSGKPYRTTVCQIQPTTLSEWRLLDAFSKDEKEQKRLELVANWYGQRITELKLS